MSCSLLIYCSWCTKSKCSVQSFSTRLCEVPFTCWRFTVKCLLPVQWRDEEIESSPIIQQCKHFILRHTDTSEPNRSTKVSSDWLCWQIWLNSFLVLSACNIILAFIFSVYFLADRSKTVQLRDESIHTLIYRFKLHFVLFAYIKYWKYGLRNSACAALCETAGGCRVSL